MNATVSRSVGAFSSELDQLRIITLTDGDMWSARDLMPYAGYSDWRNWSKAIDRAIASVNASGLYAADHFVGSNKMVEIGSGSRREVEDVEITRYGCYILFQNADGSKPEIAAAQQYFAVQTRQQESAAPAFDPTSLSGAMQLVQAAQTALEALAVAQPKADAWDELASAEGDYSVADAAKILSRAGVETGQQRLFATLSDLSWIFRNGGRWQAYQWAVDDGLLAHRMQSHRHPATDAVVIDAPQIRVTAKGIRRIRDRVRATEPIPELSG